jgi:predicted DNA-binding ribbon-helix-helix protein
MRKTLNVRLEESRLQKLRQVAKHRKKTMTQLIEEWIDRLPAPSKEDNI